MTMPAALSRLTPAARAQLIYGAARQDNEVALWRAALGDTDSTAKPATAATGNPLLDFQSLLRVLNPAASAPVVPSGTDFSAPAGTSGPLSLGANQALAPVVNAAAERTGLPPAALAAVIDAESAKGADGGWISHARNPRSSAIGLGQFLTGTWIGEAQRQGTSLRALAARRGWLDGHGKVLAGARDALLALRTDAAVSVDAVADYARANLDRLGKNGVTVGNDTSAVARTAWLAHHLGAGDAVQFLKGGLAEARASHLLAAQVGVTAAARRIAATGDATAAHRQWLLGYLDRHVAPARFTA